MRTRFPNAPAYLARYSDRTLTAYRWRRSSAQRWGGAASGNVSFDLTTTEGRAVLRSLPVAVRPAWIEAEGRRCALNVDLALANYERMRLLDYLGRVEGLRQLMVECGGNPAPAR